MSSIRTMGIRDLIRESKTIGNEAIKIKNKKTGQLLGVFVPPQYSEKAIQLIEKENERKLKRIMSFAGFATGLFPKEQKAIQKIKSQME